MRNEYKTAAYFINPQPIIPSKTHVPEARPYAAMSPREAPEKPLPPRKAPRLAHKEAPETPLNIFFKIRALKFAVLHSFT